MRLSRDKTFYRAFAILAGTLMLEQAVVLSVNLIDNIMIGNYAETSLTGVAAVNQIQFILQQLVAHLGSALIVLSAQYWGENRTAPIRRLTMVALCLAVLTALVLFTIVSVFPRELVGLFTTDAEAVSEGVKYLLLMRFSYPIFAITTVLLASMRSVETVKLALYVSMIALIVNCTINYLLIGGNLGAPEMGVEGAAIGTIVARTLEFVIVLYYVFRRDKKLCLRLCDIKSVTGKVASQFLKVGAPIVFAGLCWGIATAMQTVILGHMDTNAMTAYSISSTLYLLLKAAAVGAATAAMVICGKQVGMGNLELLKTTARTLQVLFIGIGILLGLGILLIRAPLLSLYDISEDTRALASTFMLIQSVVICTMSYQMPTNAGIIRGGGDYGFVIRMDLISLWVIVMPLSLLGAFVWHWPPAAVVLCLNADQIFKCIPAAIRCNSYKWIKKRTSDED